MHLSPVGLKNDAPATLGKLPVKKIASQGRMNSSTRVTWAFYISIQNVPVTPRNKLHTGNTLPNDSE